MTKFAVLAAVLTLGVATSAIAADRTFTYDGRTYAYSVQQAGSSQIVVGREVDSGRPFHLRISRGQVEGEYNGTPVSFRQRDVEPSASRTRSAAR